jgi:hypothetical protein
MASRLVELLPGHAEDPISWLLYEEDLANPPAYEAVSYAWGDPFDKASISVNGETLEITKSLGVALAHLRDDDHLRVLWADAIWRELDSSSARLHC